MADSTLQTQLVSSEHPHLVTEQTAQECLLLFTLELPDPELELYIQLGKDLDTFTIFPELPLELRLEIWRGAFPNPRFVHFGPSCVYRHCIDHHQLKMKDQRLPLPVTLRTNSESRTETLKCYTVVLRDEKDKLLRPLCFDHLRDKLYMGYCDDYGDPLMLDWVEQLKAKAPGGLEKVRNLELNGVLLPWCLNTTLRDQISGAYDKHLATCRSRTGGWPHCSYIHKPLLDFVMQFSELWRFDLWLQSVDSNVNDKQPLLEEYRVLLEKYFEIHKQKFEGGKIPEVRVFYVSGLDRSLEARTRHFIWY
jgi:hypothetical protein